MIVFQLIELLLPFSQVSRLLEVYLPHLRLRLVNPIFQVSNLVILGLDDLLILSNPLLKVFVQPKLLILWLGSRHHNILSISIDDLRLYLHQFLLHHLRVAVKFLVLHMQFLLQKSYLILKPVYLILLHRQFLFNFTAIMRHLLQLIFQLRSVQIFAHVALRPHFIILLQSFLQRYDHLRQVLDLVFLLCYFLVDLALVQHLGSFDAGLQAFDEVVVLVFELLDVALKLLGVFQQVFVFLSGLHGVWSVLELLDNVIVLCFQSRVFFVHHCESFIVIQIVLGDRVALQLGIMMGQRLILLQKFMVSMLPNPSSFFFDLIPILNLLVVLYVILHFLQNRSVFILSLIHSISQLIILILQGKPFLLIVNVQKLFGQEYCFFGESFVLLEEYFVLVEEVEESILPQFGLFGQLVVILRRILVALTLLLLVISLLLVVSRIYVFLALLVITRRIVLLLLLTLWVLFLHLLLVEKVLLLLGCGHCSWRVLVVCWHLLEHLALGWNYLVWRDLLWLRRKVVRLMSLRNVHEVMGMGLRVVSVSLALNYLLSLNQLLPLNDLLSLLHLLSLYYLLLTLNYLLLSLDNLLSLLSLYYLLSLDHLLALYDLLWLRLRNNLRLSLLWWQRLRHINIVRPSLHDNLILRNYHLLTLRNHLLLPIISLLNLLILLLRNLLWNWLSLLDNNLLLRNCLSLGNDLLRSRSLANRFLLRQIGYGHFIALLIQRLVNLRDNASLLRRHPSLHLIKRNHDIGTIAPRQWSLLIGRDVLADSMRVQMRIGMGLCILVRLLWVNIDGIGWIILVLELVALRKLLGILVGWWLSILGGVRPERGQQFFLLKLIFLHQRLQIQNILRIKFIYINSSHFLTDATTFRQG